MHLYNVPGVYGLSPAYRIRLIPDADADPYESTLSQVVHSFPETDDRIPSLRVYHDKEAMMKEIDLTRFFRIQGWQPSRIAEQVFHLLVVVHPQTDKVAVSSFPQSDGVGWLDGGSISIIGDGNKFLN